jgi:hypothetical protein
MPDKSRKHEPALLAQVKHAAERGQITTVDHSRKRMAGRGVFPADVTKAIATAKVAYLDKKQATVRLEGGTDVDGDDLTVVVAQDGHSWRLVTVF